MLVLVRTQGERLLVDPASEDHARKAVCARGEVVFIRPEMILVNKQTNRTTKVQT